MLPVVMLCSCHTQRTATHTSAQRTPSKEQKLTEQVIEAQTKFDNLQASKARFNIEYDTKSMAANGSLSIMTDSLIIISVQPLLGIELFRVEIDKQALMVIDKMNRKYATLSYQTVTELTGIELTYKDIEALLTDKLFVIATELNSIPDKHLKIKEETLNYAIQISQPKLDYTFLIDKPTKLLTTTMIKHQESSTDINVSYIGHQLYQEKYTFPQTELIEINTQKLKGKCTLNLLKLSFDDQKADFKRSSVSRYQKTNITNMLQ